MVYILDRATGKHVTQLEHHKGHIVTCVAFSRDGKRLISGSYQGTVKVWELTTGKELQVLKGHGSLGCVAFSSDGNTVASASAAVRVWSVKTGKEILSLPDSGTYSIAFSPDGKMLASNLKVWDLATGNELRTVPTFVEAPTLDGASVAFSPDGKTLASASQAGLVQLWDVSTGKQLAQPHGHDSGVSSMAITPDGKTIATGSLDGIVKMWDVTTGKELRALKAYVRDGSNEVGVRALAFSPDGKTLASGGSDLQGMLKLWDVATGKQQRSLQGHGSGVLCVAFSPNGKVLASGSSDQTLRFWDVASGQETKAFRPGSTVFSVAFSPDGEVVSCASGVAGGDGTLKLWETATGKERGTFRGAPHHAHLWYGSCLSFSPDGKTLAATGTDSSVVKLWDVATMEERRTLKGHTGSVLSGVFAPDGKSFFSSGSDGTVRCWDPDAPPGQPLLWQTFTLGPPHGYVRQVALSPEGRHLITLNGNGTIYVLRLAPPPQSKKVDADVPAAKPADDADRKAAEWVLSIGGAVTIAVGDKNQDIQAAKDLPAQPVRLVAVALTFLQQVSDAGLKHLSGLTNLTRLRLSNTDLTHTHVTDAGMVHLKGLTNLTELALGCTGVSDGGLVHLKGLTNLTMLELYNMRVSDAGLMHLKGLTNLTALVLYNTRVSDTGLVYLTGLSKLTALTLDNALVSDTGLVHLKGLTNLTELRLGGTRVSDASLEWLATLNIRHLNLDGTRISAKGFAELKAALGAAQISWSEPNRTAAETVLDLGGTVLIRVKGGPHERTVAAVGELPAAYFQVIRASLADVKKPLGDAPAKLAALTDPDFDHLEVLDVSGAALGDDTSPR